MSDDPDEPVDMDLDSDAPRDDQAVEGLRARLRDELDEALKPSTAGLYDKLSGGLADTMRASGLTEGIAMNLAGSMRVSGIPDAIAGSVADTFKAAGATGALEALLSSADVSFIAPVPVSSIAQRLFDSMQASGALPSVSPMVSNAAEQALHQMLEAQRVPLQSLLGQVRAEALSIIEVQIDDSIGIVERVDESVAVPLAEDLRAALGAFVATMVVVLMLMRLGTMSRQEILDEVIHDLQQVLLGMLVMAAAGGQRPRGGSTGDH